MRLLLDTHILLWISGRDRRLTNDQKSAIGDPDNALFVSAAAAFELAHLQADGRLQVRESIEVMRSAIGFDILDLPAQCWSVVADLPMIHRDPVDRMQIAHALVGGFTLVTADGKIRRYPVATI